MSFSRFFQEGRESPFNHLFSSGLCCGNNFSPSVSTLSVLPNQISCLFSASPLFHPLAFSACIKWLVKCFPHTTLSVCFSLSLLGFTASSEEFLFLLSPRFSDSPLPLPCITISSLLEALFLRSHGFVSH